MKVDQSAVVVFFLYFCVCSEFFFFVPSISANLSVSVGSYQSSSLIYNGQSFYAQNNYNNLISNIIFTNPADNSVSGTVSQPTFDESNPHSSNPLTNTVTQTYNNGVSMQFTISVNYMVLDSDTLCINISITNQDPELHNLQQFDLGSFFWLQLPDPANQYDYSIPIYIDNYQGNPAGLLSGSWGSVAMWMGCTTCPSQLTTSYGSSSQTTFTWAFRNYYPNPNENQPYLSSIQKPTIIDPISPGQSKFYEIYFRFSSTQYDRAIELAPEPFQNFRKTYPSLINWSV